MTDLHQGGHTKVDDLLSCVAVMTQVHSLMVLNTYVWLQTNSCNTEMGRHDLDHVTTCVPV